MKNLPLISAIAFIFFAISCEITELDSRNFIPFVKFRHSLLPVWVYHIYITEFKYSKLNVNISKMLL